jgi:osmotically-inducible protein OsmY
MNGKESIDRGWLAGPGYMGFGGSAGYIGGGAGGVSGSYAEVSTPEPWQPGPVTRHDDRIHDEISQLLNGAKHLDARTVHVDVEAGVVTLRGRTHSRVQKQAAAELARAVSGVRLVHDRLAVGSSWFEKLNDWASKLL